MRVKVKVNAVMLGLGLISLSGCTYYRVRDVASGKEYVTDNWHMGQSGWNGATSFTDLKTGKGVVLQSYEVERLNGDVAKAEIGSGKD